MRHSPEPCLSIEEAVKTDVYSFGILFWEVLKHGEPCFDMLWLAPGGQGKKEVEDGVKEEFLNILPQDGLLYLSERWLSEATIESILLEETGHVLKCCLRDNTTQRGTMADMGNISIIDRDMTRYVYDFIRKHHETGS